MSDPVTAAAIMAGGNVLGNIVGGSNGSEYAPEAQYINPYTTEQGQTLWDMLLPALQGAAGGQAYGVPNAYQPGAIGDIQGYTPSTYSQVGPYQTSGYNIAPTSQITAENLGYTGQNYGYDIAPTSEIQGYNPTGYNIAPTSQITGYNTPGMESLLPGSDWMSSLSPELTSAMWKPYEEGLKTLETQLSGRGQLGSERGGISGAAADVLQDYAIEASDEYTKNLYDVWAPAAYKGYETELGAEQDLWNEQLTQAKNVWAAQTEANKYGVEQGNLAEQNLWNEKLNQAKDVWAAQTEANKYAADQGKSISDLIAQGRLTQAQDVFNAQNASNLYGAEQGNLANQWSANANLQQTISEALGQTEASQWLADADLQQARDWWTAQTGSNQEYWQAQLGQNQAAYNTISQLLNYALPDVFTSASPLSVSDPTTYTPSTEGVDAWGNPTGTTGSGGDQTGNEGSGDADSRGNDRDILSAQWNQDLANQFGQSRFYNDWTSAFNSPAGTTWNDWANGTLAMGSNNMATYTPTGGGNPYSFSSWESPYTVAQNIPGLSDYWGNQGYSQNWWDYSGNPFSYSFSSPTTTSTGGTLTPQSNIPAATTNPVTVPKSNTYIPPTASQGAWLNGRWVDIGQKVY
jgi:hypothetical protein